MEADTYVYRKRSISILMLGIIIIIFFARFVILPNAGVIHNYQIEEPAD